MNKDIPAAEQNPYGLKWNFKLIDYTSGTNATSDSQHCTLNGSVLTPCGVTNGVANGVANPVSIGRRPLVRVTVTDEAGKIVLVGFIKVEITQQVAYQEALPTSFDVKFGCEDAVLKQTWAQFVDNVLDYTTDLSKEQFAAIYELETVGTTAVQYVKANNKYVKATAAETLGTVTEVSENYGTTTNVLTWTIPSTGQERVFEAQGETIYVRYIYKDSTPTTEYEGIYVPFTVTVTKPVGKVSKKISEYWFNGGANAIINVARPTDNGSTYDWVTYINQVWEKNAPKFNQTAGYASYNTLTYKYYFSPVQPKLTVAGVDYQLVTDSQKLAIKSGYNYFNVTIPAIKDNAKIAEYENSYAIDADAEIYKNNKLYAAYKATPTATTLTKVHIATIDQTNSTVTYEHNEIAELLLNAFASVPREDAKLFANIGVVAANTCGIALSLTENETNPYYFLRPLNIYAIDGAQFEDAEANGSKVNVIDLFNITDWRNVTFVTPTYKNIWLFAYYNVKNVFVDVENAMCDLNQADGSFVKMSDITSFIGLEHIGSKVNGGVMTDLDYTGYNSADKSTAAIYEKYVKAFGQISYKNNGTNVDGFQIKVPVTFTYDWGKATIDVVIPVVKTMGN